MAMNIQQKNFENDFKNALNVGYVVFTYRKVDGSIRKAVGTRNLDIIFRISDWRPAGGSEDNRTIRYFDIVENEWRSIRCGNLVEVEHIKYRGTLNSDENDAIRAAIGICLDKNYVMRIPDLIEIMLGDDMPITLSNRIEAVTRTYKRTIADVIEEMRITQAHMDELIKELESMR